MYRIKYLLSLDDIRRSQEGKGHEHALPREAEIIAGYSACNNAHQRVIDGGGNIAGALAAAFDAARQAINRPALSSTSGAGADLHLTNRDLSLQARALIIINGVFLFVAGQVDDDKTSTLTKTQALNGLRRFTDDFAHLVPGAAEEISDYVHCTATTIRSQPNRAPIEYKGPTVPPPRQVGRNFLKIVR